ncbi:MAG: hypothetical protein IJR66_03405 [Clostridia bacterium]|nr:hypothetical protein [Clostridia bacterium]MBQ9514006.1 hypothetical protein [Clostridia bacterium]
MKPNQITFALYYGNRGFFPGEVIADARKSLKEAVTKCGYDYIEMDESKTRYGAVETIAEGQQYAAFLDENKGKYDGIIVCLPNFGDENGAYYALKDANVPILIQAYPDELGKMDFARRRDAVCGKIAMCNVLRQAGIKYSLTKKFAVNPLSSDFAEDLRIFAGTCRVVKGMSAFSIGAIGARTTAFKTVRVDEIAMQKKKINIETIDMSMVFSIMDNVDKNELTAKKEEVRKLADFGNFPEIKVENLARFYIAMDKLIKDYALDALAIRCWNELQLKYGIAPCVVMGDLNGKGVCASCELDINNTVMMRALTLASNNGVMLFDVNNNYGESGTKTVLFHCGPAPLNMMEGPCHIEEHLMFKKSYGDNTGVGLRVGKVKSQKVTIGSMRTEDGKLCSFVSEGKLTDDKLDAGFFGCGTVYESDGYTSDELLNYMSKNGFRHHVAIASGEWADSVKDAFDNYLEYEIDVL